MKKNPRSAAALQKSNLLLTMIGRNFKTAYAKGDFAAALKFAQQAQKLNPQSPAVFSDIALCHMQLGQAAAAISAALSALQKLPEPSLSLLDILADSHGKLGDLEAVRLWGRQALEKRDQTFGQVKVTALPKVIPPKPSPQTKEKNIIAYSLFGALPKYCEVAVLNTQLAAQIYPDWSLLVYLDESVPEHVVARLKANGAQVIFVEGEMKQWPAPMWRFAAYDLPDLHRVSFRDADALISEREALSVKDWIESTCSFHHMRDAPSHSELLLAGLWGVTAGALPPMAKEINRFLAKGVESAHFADQYFLRAAVWPYAKQDLFQNDSLFGAFDAKPFAQGPYSEAFHVGCAEVQRVDIATPLPDGVTAKWTFYEGEERTPICHYLGKAQGGVITATLPNRYIEALKAGRAIIQSGPS